MPLFVTYVDKVTYREKKALDAQGQCNCTLPYPEEITSDATKEEFEAYEAKVETRFELCI